MHFLDVILELEAETLSESRFFNARSDQMGFRSSFYQNQIVLGPQKGRRSILHGDFGLLRAMQNVTIRSFTQSGLGGSNP